MGTKAAVKPFRLDPTAALSYFVGANTDYPEDKGFALKPWTGVRFENNGVLLEGPQRSRKGIISSQIPMARRPRWSTPSGTSATPRASCASICTTPPCLSSQREGVLIGAQ